MQQPTKNLPQPGYLKIANSLFPESSFSATNVLKIWAAKHKDSVAIML